METEAGDVCAWCKRPLRGKSVYGSFDYVREGEGLSPGDRVMPLFGGIIVVGFLAVLGYALVSQPTKSPTTPKAETVAEFGSTSAPTVSSSYTSPGASTGGVSGGSKGTPFPAENRSGYSGVASIPSSSLGRPSQATASADAGAPSANLTVSAGRFRIAKATDGSFILYGEADLDNSGGDPITNARFVMNIGDDGYQMTVYSGDIHRPVYVMAPEIPPGKTTVFLINKEIAAKVLHAEGRRTLTVDGKNSNGPLQGSVLLE